MAGPRNPTHEHDSDRDDAIEARLAYRSAAAEKPSGQLDDTILDLARREVGKDQWFGWALPWLRPAAFVATAGLSLAVVMQLGVLSDTTNGLAGPDSPAETPAAVVEDFTSAAQDSTSRIRTIGENAAQRDLQGDRLPFTPVAPDADSFCSTEETSAPESWQRCIRVLRESGKIAAARSEALRLSEAFPGFVAPPE